MIALVAALTISTTPIGEIAYMRSGKVWLMNADGTQNRKIADASYDRPLVWSPDGSKLVFWKEEPSWNLFSWDHRTGRIQNLTRNRTADNRAASFSRDGRRIAFMSGEKGLCLMNADGSGLRVLSEKGHRDEPPQWVTENVIAFLDIPDESFRMLYYDLEKNEVTHGPASFFARSAGDDMFAYILNSEPTKIRRGSFRLNEWSVLDLGNKRILEFEWAPNRGMALKSHVPEKALYWMAPTAKLKLLTPLSSQGWQGVTVSPDSNFVGFSDGPRTKESIYLINVTAGKPKAIAKGVWPAWRPKT